jgi:hypothetical protein
MDNEEERTEYVLEQIGLIWRGSAGANGPLRWNYKQVRREYPNWKRVHTVEPRYNERTARQYVRYSEGFVKARELACMS